ARRHPCNLRDRGGVIMSDAVFESLQADGVTITPRLDGGVLHVAMAGSLESRDPRATFDPYWTALDDSVRHQKVAKVVLDIRGLDYMNSSGILTLARWLMRAMQHAVYTVVIEHDADVTWQHSNVPVLAKLAPTVVHVGSGT